MKTSKRILSAALSLMLIFSLTACDEGGAQSGDAAITTTAATTTVNTLDNDIENPVDISEIVENQTETKTLENPNIKYLGFYDMRLAGDIKPGVKLFEETYGGKIEYIQCSWSERMDKLLSLISSDESPDLVDKEDSSFPHLMSKKAYSDLTEYIDLSQPQWEGYEELIKNYSWNGKQYYYPFTASAISNCLIYKKSLFDQYGLDDPQEMYVEGNWTWKAFKEKMIEFMNQGGDDVVGGVYGLLGSDIIMSTGTALIGRGEDGKAVSNFSTLPVERAADFLSDLRKEGLTARGDGMWSNESAPLADGKVAFLGVGTWKLADFCKDYPDAEWGIVPFPRDENADKYYYAGSNFGYMVPAGSKNIEGAAAFIDIMRQCQVDPELQAIVKQSIMNDKKYTDEQYDFLKQFDDIGKYDIVTNMSYGFNAETTNLIDTMLVNIAYAQNEDQQSWTSLRSANEGIIEDTIAQYNTAE